MKRITRVSRLRNCGVFRDFEWPKDLPDFGRYNLIYGWNGTGKTTLSRILRCLEKRAAPEGDVTIAVDGKDLRGYEFPTATIPVRVFNRDFVTENVFPVGGRDLPPIFVLGVESIEKQRELNRLKEERTSAQSKLDSARFAKQNAERYFDQFCIDRAKVIKDTLRSSGQNPYNNYDKSDFKKDAEKMAAAGGGAGHRLTDAERDRLLAQHRATAKPRLVEVTYALPNFNAILDRLSQLLATTVVSAVIEALKADPELAGWTREGLRLHRERKAERCLFCEQPLPKDRLTTLGAHFSAEYEKFMQALHEFIGELQKLSKQTGDLHLPNKAELYEDLAEDFQIAETGLRDALRLTREFLETAVQSLEEKKHQAFEPVAMTLRLPQVDADAVQKLNAVIRKHNQACNDFQTRVNEARERLGRDMIAEKLDTFVELQQTVQTAMAEEQAATQEVQRLDAAMADLEREIVEHRRPAEELNEDLRKYLGHDELRLEIKDTGYAITRGGVPAFGLSEGEMTAIALLYFLKSLQDKEFDPTKGIVVLDDPVSSLDANALYLAFGFIRERAKDAGQLFIFTHNFTLFRQVRNWFHHLKGQNSRHIDQRPARFYMLDCANEQNGRSASIRRLDPLLEQYESEYHYLFACVYRAANEGGRANLKDNYVLPNMARRLLETFLAFRQPQVSWEIWQKMNAVTFDEAKKLRILRFLNTYSHSGAPGEPEHDLSVLAEGGAVLKDLLELIQSQDGAHYSAMVKLVSEPDNSVEEG